MSITIVTDPLHYSDVVKIHNPVLLQFKASKTHASYGSLVNASFICEGQEYRAYQYDEDSTDKYYEIYIQDILKSEAYKFDYVIDFPTSIRRNAYFLLTNITSFMSANYDTDSVVESLNAKAVHGAVGFSETPTKDLYYETNKFKRSYRYWPGYPSSHYTYTYLTTEDVRLTNNDYPEFYTHEDLDEKLLYESQFSHDPTNTVEANGKYSIIQSATLIDGLILKNGLNSNNYYLYGIKVKNLKPGTNFLIDGATGGSPQLGVFETSPGKVDLLIKDLGGNVTLREDINLNYIRYVYVIYNTYDNYVAIVFNNELITYTNQFNATSYSDIYLGVMSAKIQYDGYFEKITKRTVLSHPTILPGNNSININPGSSTYDKNYNFKGIYDQEGVYLRWLNRDGIYQEWLFSKYYQESNNSNSIGSVKNNDIRLPFPDSYITPDSRTKNIGNTSNRELNITSENLTDDEYDTLIEIADSPEVYYFKAGWGGVDQYKNWERVRVTSSSTKNSELQYNDINLTIIMSDKYNIRR